MKPSPRTPRKAVAHAPQAVSKKCECGSCTECSARSRGQTLSPPEAPLSVRNVLQTPGQPLDGATREFLEPRFHYDLSRVRVHSDAPAARSASDVGARAWTVGNHIAFGAGMYAPSTPRGAGLLAHELTHVEQQQHTAISRQPAMGRPGDRLEREADTHARIIAAGHAAPRATPAPAPVLQRSILSGFLDVLLFVPRLFGLEYFPAEQLRDYLATLRQNRGPARTLFSDNKARACVKREGELGPYDLDTKTWLVQDMLDGWTSFLDEGAIIDLLRRSPSQRTQIVNAVGRVYLWSKFDGRNRRIIEAMTMTAADAGDGLVSRLRNLTPDELGDYSSNTTDPAVLESVRRATALNNITAPVPAGAGISPSGEASITINRIQITVRPDSVNPSLGTHGMTYGEFTFEQFAPVPITPENANEPTGALRQLGITLAIWTEFPSVESKNEASGYGAGGTLREHERAHGQGYFDFVRDNAPPVFQAHDGMTFTGYNAAIQQYRAAAQEYLTRARDFALRAGDCSVPGRYPTDEQLAGTGYTAAICHEIR